MESVQVKDPFAFRAGFRHVCLPPAKKNPKETILYDRGDGTAEKVNMIGYPHILFEDYTGNLMSLSTGLKKNHISQGIQGKADFFIEKVGS